MAKINLPTLQLEGIIYNTFNKPLPKAIVQIFNKDLLTEQLLGTVKTDKNGKYMLKYKANSFSRAEKKSADIFLRIFVDKLWKKNKNTHSFQI